MRPKRAIYVRTVHKARLFAKLIEFLFVFLRLGIAFQQSSHLLGNRVDLRRRQKCKRADLRFLAVPAGARVQLG